jgi:hypothetical protein
MSVFVFSKKEAPLKTVFPKNAQFPSSPISEHAPENGDISYVDVSGFTAPELKKTITQLKKTCADSSWGIIDPKGEVHDSAALFFEGACDYLGPSFFKESASIEPKRLKDALSWRKEYLAAVAAAKEDAKSGKGDKSASLPKTGIKLPSASSFPGWKKMPVGKAASFYLLYCCVQGKVPLDAKLDEKTFAIIHKRFISLLDDNFEKGNGLFWMNSGKDCLFLIPPIAKCAEAAIKACVGMIASAPLIIMETLDFKFPVNFVFALHYGSLSYKPPGHTGTIVSDAVNFIFHLGAKRAEPGRLTISGELPDNTIPKSLEDCFISAGEFEDRKIWHTKKFVYAKPWV